MIAQAARAISFSNVDVFDSIGHLDRCPFGKIQDFAVEIIFFFESGKIVDQIILYSKFDLGPIWIISYIIDYVSHFAIICEYIIAPQMESCCI